MKQLLPVLLLAACAPVATHFIDSSGRALDDYESVWTTVAQVCGDALPDKIELNVGASPSRASLARETTRTCVAKLTHNVSREELYLPLTHGLELIAAAEAEDQLPMFRRRVHMAAASAVASQPTTEETAASFLLFIRARYGLQALTRIFIAIGRTRSLDAATQQSLHKTVGETESAWARFLATLVSGESSAASSETSE